MPKARIEGSVAAGYEPVREVFERQFADSRHANAQVCAYVGGVRVVDLWGSAVGDDEYDGDSIQTVFSSTKSVTSIAFACLVGTGAVDYSDKISKHWPQFGKNGKEDLKIEDLMRHEGGLARWAGSITYEDTLRENIKNNSIGKVIEEEELSFPGGERGKREYHGLTRGWILNEIFQRVHPDGKTIGEFLSEEIAGPLGIDVYIGAPDEGKRNCKLTAPTNGYLLLNSALPGFISRRVEVSTLQMIKSGLAIAKNAKKAGQAVEEKARTAFPIAGVAPKDLAPTNMCNVLDTITMRRGESPSANGACSARGLAKLGAAVVGGGEVDGVRIMSEESVEAMHENVVTKKNVSVFGLHSNFTQGGVNVFKSHPDECDDPVLGPFNGLREGFVGWQGFGGSVFQWHPELEISFAFVPTWLAWYDACNTRGGELQKAVADCAGDIAKAKSSQE